jgi:hypothetical protein
MRPICIFCILLSLAACNPAPPDMQTRIVEVPSSKPYRFITFGDGDDPQTIREIKRHNRAHQEVINAEKAPRNVPTK